jgi:hypothetical protein
MIIFDLDQGQATTLLQTGETMEAPLTRFCSDQHCTECRSILLRTYRELRAGGYGDEKAFQAATHVLALRHPGHDRDYYVGLAAQWIEAEVPN